MEQLWSELERILQHLKREHATSLGTIIDLRTDEELVQRGVEGVGAKGQFERGCLSAALGK